MNLFRFPITPRVLFACSLITVLQWSPAIVRGVNTQWDTDNSGSFTSPANWNNGAPGPDDRAVFRRGEGVAYTVGFPGFLTHVTDQLRVGSNAVTFFSIDASYMVDNPATDDADRAIVIANQAADVAILTTMLPVSAAAVTVGDAAMATGTLNVATDALIITGGSADDELIIGNHGTGVLNVTGGADLNMSGGPTANAVLGKNAGASGTATISGAGSSWIARGLVVGAGGSGEINVESGGSLVSGKTTIGRKGMVSVVGAESTWTGGSVVVDGDFAIGANAHLTVSDGGQVTTASLELGATAGTVGVVMVAGATSAIHVHGLLDVGGFGGGRLIVSDGGLVTNFDARIARDPGSIAVVQVSGAGSRWTTAGRLEVGGPATESGRIAIVEILAGATASVSQQTWLFPDGRILLNGGTLSMLSLEFRGGGTFEWDAGVLHVDTYMGTLLNTGGTLAPGNSVGHTTIEGDYIQSGAGVLQIEIGAGGADRVTVDDGVALGGDLELAILNDFTPAGGGMFTVLQSGNSGITGSFANVDNGQRLTTIDGLGSFVVHYGAGSAFDPNHIVLTNFQLAADFDEDGDVDGDDLVRWRSGFGAAGSATHMQGDADNDQDVDGADFLTWQRQVGADGSLAASTAVVPEPATITLLALASATARTRRRRVSGAVESSPC